MKYTIERVEKVEGGTMIPDNIIIFAFRYCLGRMSTAPGSMVDYLKTVWKKLNVHTRDLIQREIREGLRHGENEKPGIDHPLGMQCDIDNWKKVLEYDK
jgi:hypothetical protein